MDHENSPNAFIHHTDKSIPCEVLSIKNDTSPFLGEAPIGHFLLADGAGEEKKWM